MGKTTSIFWFRQDLRLADNPALIKAAQHGSVIPVYILENRKRPQSASDWWLHHSLNSLNKSLGGRLYFFRGKPLDVLLQLAEKTGAQHIYYSRLYTPDETKRDTEIETSLIKKGLEVNSDNASLLWEPWEVLKDDGTPYKVFTPYFKRCKSDPLPPRAPLQAPKLTPADAPDSLPLEALALLPKIRWDKKLEHYWHIGEKAAQEKLADFIEANLEGYKKKRDFPADDATSRLSPHLHFGEISPHQIWHQIMKTPPGHDRDHFLSELGWREFSHMLLYHFPHSERENLNPKFDGFSWRDDEDALQAWQKGQTGIPIIDAGMRELWETGVMHNRVRMLTASYLTKNLLIHWRHGEAWFFDCLVDADLANNVAGWQWVAGSGADAAPYFRIFNPVTQSRKFDPEGAYIRRFVPELSQLPDQYIHEPWEADEKMLNASGIQLGMTYPHPVTDLKFSRERALQAYKAI